MFGLKYIKIILSCAIVLGYSSGDDRHVLMEQRKSLIECYNSEINEVSLAEKKITQELVARCGKAYVRITDIETDITTMNLEKFHERVREGIYASNEWVLNVASPGEGRCTMYDSVDMAEYFLHTTVFAGIIIRFIDSYGGVKSLYELYKSDDNPIRWTMYVWNKDFNQYIKDNIKDELRIFGIQLNLDFVTSHES